MRTGVGVGECTYTTDDTDAGSMKRTRSKPSLAAPLPPPSKASTMSSRTETYDDVNNNTNSTAVHNDSSFATTIPTIPVHVFPRATEGVIIPLNIGVINHSTPASSQDTKNSTNEAPIIEVGLVSHPKKIRSTRAPPPPPPLVKDISDNHIDREVSDNKADINATIISDKDSKEECKITDVIDNENKLHSASNSKPIMMKEFNTSARNNITSVAGESLRGVSIINKAQFQKIIQYHHIASTEGK